MKVDADKSKFKESLSAESEFDSQEIRNLRQLLRRLRFLEQMVEEHGGLKGGSGGAAFAEMEMGALEWVLSEVGYLDTIEKEK